VFIVLKRSNPFQVETGGKGLCHENGARFQFCEMSSFVVVVVDDDDDVERFYTKVVVRCRKLIITCVTVCAKSIKVQFKAYWGCNSQEEVRQKNCRRLVPDIAVPLCPT